MDGRRSVGAAAAELALRSRYGTLPPETMRILHEVGFFVLMMFFWVRLVPEATDIHRFEVRAIRRRPGALRRPLPGAVGERRPAHRAVRLRLGLGATSGSEPALLRALDPLRLPLVLLAAVRGHEPSRAQRETKVKRLFCTKDSGRFRAARESNRATVLQGSSSLRRQQALQLSRDCTPAIVPFDQLPARLT